jgi:predicted enzyme related to lactoylglutathione lyase
MTHSETNGDTDADRRIDYVEFTVSDMARTKAFYAEAFGWTYTDFGPSYTEFTDGRMKGGFDASEPVRAGGPLVVLYGRDLAALAQAVEQAGGRIVKPVFEFPGGRRFHFTDPDGYELAIWSDA